MSPRGVAPETLAEYQRWRRAKALQYFGPHEELSPADWVEANRVLGPPSMSEGPFRWSEGPYMRAVFERFWSRDFTEGSMMKGSQVIFTDGLLMNIVAYAAVKRPASVSILLPSELFAEDFSKDKVEPLLEHTPIVGQHFRSLGARDRDATLLNKKMRSGHRLRLFGANSVARLKSFGSEIRLLDEIDEFENDEKQGDPEKLLDRAAYRAQPGRAKKLAGGSPTMFPSRIAKKFEAGTQERWMLTCAVCGMPFAPLWKHVKWERTTQHHPESAHWCCPQGHHLPQSLTRTLVTNGYWLAHQPHAPLPSWHAPGLISLSPSMTLGHIATEFLKAGKDPAQLKVVANTMWGEPFEDKREKIVVASLKDRREVYEAEVPRGVGLLTMAVDVQRGKDARLEVLIVGWGAREESWRIHHYRLYGDVRQLTSQPGEAPTPWERLDVLRTKWYVHAAGVGLRIERTGIDSADGEMTDIVYQYVKPRQDEGVMALRGVQKIRGVTRRSRMQEMVQEGRAKDQAVRLVNMNTYALKDRLFARLRPEEEVARMHWPLLRTADGSPSPEFPADYWKQFEGESRQDVPVSKHSSETESVYVQTGDNESIDLEVQSLATLYAGGSDTEIVLETMVAEVQARGRVYAAQRASPASSLSVPPASTAAPERELSRGFYRPR